MPWPRKPLSLDKAAQGRQSEAQRAFEQAVSQQGYQYSLCRSFQEFQTLVQRYLTT